MKVSTTDYTYFITKKYVVWIRISLDTNTKTLAALILQIS